MDVNVEVAARKKLREPQQGRSRASFERMLATAEQLMIERGSDDFTLNDVAKVGKVSIGSIYCRFDSKDDLIHAVQARVLERVDIDMMARIAEARDGAADLDDVTHRLVENVAETLRRHQSVMRPLMLRASSDPVVAGVGKRSYEQTAQAVSAAILNYAGEIAHPEPQRASDAAFVILYAAIARYLGFGSSGDAAGQGDWGMLKQDLADMTSAFLKAVPRRHR